jgi:hypothetical protein
MITLMLIIGILMILAAPIAMWTLIGACNLFSYLVDKGVL